MSIQNSIAKFQARVERGDNFLLTASPEQLAQLTRGVKSSYQFFMTSPLLFGEDCITVNGLRDFKMLRRHFVHFLTRAHAQYPNQGFQTILTRFDRKRKITRPLIDKLCDEIVRGDIPFIPGFDALARCTELLPTTRTRVLGHEKDPENVNNTRRALIHCNTLKQRASEAGFPTLSAQAHTKRYVALLVTALNRRARRRRRDLHRAVRARSPAQTPATPLDLSTAQGRLIAWLKRSPARMHTPDSDAALRLNRFLGRAHRTATWPAVLNAANQALRIARQGTSDLHSAAIVSLNIASAHARLAATITISDDALPNLFKHNRSTDIFLLQETLSEQLPIARSLGYTMTSQARANKAKGGGTAILVRSHLSPIPLQNASFQSKGVDEAEWLTVKLNTLPHPTFLATLYRPPNSSHANDARLSALFAEQLQPLAATGSLIIGCDLNVDFANPRASDRQPINAWRPALRSLGAHMPIEIHFTTATRSTRINGNAVIDYLFAIKVPAPIARCHLLDVGSDHYALITLAPKLLTLADPPPAPNWRKALNHHHEMSKVTNAVAELLDNPDNNITTAKQLIDSVNSIALDHLKTAPDLKTRANRRDTWQKAGWWTSELTALVNETRRHSRRIAELNARLRASARRPQRVREKLAENLQRRHDLLSAAATKLSTEMRAAKTKYFN
jgi:hypothetical protein